jgi:hypothetical protein
MRRVSKKPNTGEVALSGVSNLELGDSCETGLWTGRAVQRLAQNAPNKIAPTNINTADTTSMSSFKVRSKEVAPSAVDVSAV